MLDTRLSRTDTTLPIQSNPGSCLGFRSGAIAALLLPALFNPLSAPAQPATYVIHISIDGLRPDAITALGPSALPHFYRMRTQGAFSDNARSDYDYTVTLPNHICQLTGRGVVGASGHNWADNGDPAPGETLASNKGSYIAGAFDVAHDNGLRTGEYATKSKFALFSTSWDAVNGALDVTGPDNGRDKIDVYVLNTANTAALVNSFIMNMAAQPFGYAFLHLRDPDSIGHSSGWDPTPGSPYSNVIKQMNDRLGSIFELIDTNSALAGRTAILLTADHGGSGGDHADPTLAADYTIPFYVWGPGVMPGADLYVLNQSTRLDPGTGRPLYSDPIQPIRNGEAANVALKLLGLGPVPGSTINSAQNLALTLPPPQDLAIALNGSNLRLSFSTISNVLYDVETTASLTGASWSGAITNIPGSGTATNLDLGPPLGTRQFYRLKPHFGQ
jgi:hypothetical protein